MRKTKNKNVTSMSAHVKRISPWNSSRISRYFASKEKGKLSFKERLFKFFFIPEEDKSDKKRKPWTNKKEMKAYKRRVRDSRRKSDGKLRDALSF